MARRESSKAGPQDLVFEQRAPLHYSYRLASHFSLLVRGVTKTTKPWRWAFLGAASMAGDVVVGRALRAGRTDLYGLRLLVDVIDVAAWVPVGKRDAVTTRSALLVAVPHAMEAGYEIGVVNDWTWRALARALAIPVVTTSAAVLMRRRHGLGMGSTQVFWGVMGVAMTSLLGRHEYLERKRAQAAGDEVVAARSRGARLQGEAEIALGGAGAAPHDLKKALLVLANSG